MIVKILSDGKSFSGLANYLSHDADRAQTTERVSWTHTLNCANENVPCAVNEMYWTTRDAELLKQEAGIRPGGRATEKTVKHFSVSWSPDEKPSREHMLETTQDFLRHMGWEDHQAILFSHTDKPYAHVHGMLNTVHPATGLRLDDNYEQVRAQAWAMQYEREHGIFCEERLKNANDREKSPSRNIWMAFQENEWEFARSERSLENNSPIFAEEPKNLRNSEWRILKEFQRDERIEFFAQGKSEFNQLRKSIYRGIRDEFRRQWADYYAAKKDGADIEALASRKAEIVAEQKALLDARRDDACRELRATRDDRYRGLLDEQREARAELRWRQEAGLDNALFLNRAMDGHEKELAMSFRETAREVASPGRSPETFGQSWAGHDHSVPISPRDDSDLGRGLKSEVVSFFDSLAYDLINLGSAGTQRI